MSNPNDESPVRRDSEEANWVTAEQETPTAQIAHQIIEAVSYHQGPVPSPEALEHYDRVMPGLADRLVKLVENEAEHRQQTETSIVQGGLKLRARGQWLAFVIAMTGLIGGIYVIATGHSGTGIGVILSALAPIVGAFLYTYVGQRRVQGQGNLPEQRNDEDSQ